MNKVFLTGGLAAMCISSAFAVPTSWLTGLPSSGTPSAGGVDPQYFYTFTSADITVSGFLDASANGDGTYTAMTGTIDVAGDPNLGAASGTLTSNPNGTSASLSSSGFFIYDDQLLPSGNPLITNPGLLFNVAGTEVNIFSNGPGPGSYQFYDNTGYTEVGDFTLTQVTPEPFTICLGIAGVAVAAKRRKASLA